MIVWLSLTKVSAIYSFNAKKYRYTLCFFIFFRIFMVLKQTKNSETHHCKYLEFLCRGLQADDLGQAAMVAYTA